MHCRTTRVDWQPEQLTHMKLQHKVLVTLWYGYMKVVGKSVSTARWQKEYNDRKLRSSGFGAWEMGLKIGLVRT